jgi:hypothetical protein
MSADEAGNDAGYEPSIRRRFADSHREIEASSTISAWRFLAFPHQLVEIRAVAHAA